MSATLRPPIAPIGWSIALHAVLAALLIFGLSLPDREPDMVLLPIDAVVVDDAVLQAAGQQRRDDERREALRQEQAAAKAEAERQEEELRQQQEAERLQQEQDAKRAEEEARLAAERKATAEAEAKRNIEREAAAKAAAEKKRAAAEQRERDAREAELRAQLAEEETRTSAGFQSLKASYVRAIQAHVEQRWFEPPGGTQGLSCTVFVTQIPGGEVIGMRFGPCNGGAAVRQSIENAVRNASPLPAPPEPALFEREVKLVFTPKESRR
ncbi:MAG TPA: cell envelope integrity protein TolA [Steroidobacteraceae bacterium]|nr:cell envelope integrity protein TolA [Steroidobacteraceae bacterium]